MPRSLIAGGLVALLGLAYAFVAGREERPLPGRHDLRLTGVTYVASEAGLRTLSLSAREIRREKRRIGPFTLNPLDEIHLSDLRLVLPLEESDPAPAVGPSGTDALDLIPAEARTSLEETSQLLDARFVSRLVVDRFEVSWLRREGEAAMHLTAGRLRAESGVLRLERGLHLVDVEGAVLRAGSARWHPREQILSVSGRYELVRSGARSVGEGDRFSVDDSGRLQRMDAPRRLRTVPTPDGRTSS